MTNFEADFNDSGKYGDLVEFHRRKDFDPFAEQLVHV